MSEPIPIEQAKDDLIAIDGPAGELLPIDPRETLLDEQSAVLIEHIRRSLMIQAEMFRRLLDTTPKPSVLLAELLEDTGNRYIDFAERVSVAARIEFID
jgi:hypothetical protein